MQEKENLTIYHRLFNFILNSLIARGLKRVTLGRPVPVGGSAEDQPLDHDPVMNEEQQQPQDDDDLGFEVEIQFKEAVEEFENWTPVDDEVVGSPVHVSEQDGPKKELSIAQSLSEIQEKIGSEIQGKGSQEVEIIFTTDQGRVRDKGKDIASDQNMSIAMEPAEDTRLKSSGLSLSHVRPRFTVVANINEKSDAFIRSRKEAMTREL